MACSQESATAPFNVLLKQRLLSVQAKLLNGRTDSFGAQQAKPMRRNLPPLQLGHEELLSRDAARQTTLWSKENDVSDFLQILTRSCELRLKVYTCL